MNQDEPRLNPAEYLKSERYHKWLKVPFQSHMIREDALLTIQGLGLVDVKLEAMESLDFKENDLLLNELIVTSQLWTMGAYEIIRTICQYVSESAHKVSEEERNEIIDLKKLFARIRMPLAKLEASSAHKSTDRSIAYPVITGNRVGWRVSEDYEVSRDHLALEFQRIMLTVFSGQPQPHENQKG